jgi:hypothetical protein
MRHRQACGDGFLRGKVHEDAAVATVIAPPAQGCRGTRHADECGAGAVHGKPVQMAAITANAGRDERWAPQCLKAGGIADCIY